MGILLWLKKICDTIKTTIILKLSLFNKTNKIKVQKNGNKSPIVNGTENVKIAYK